MKDNKIISYNDFLLKIKNNPDQLKVLFSYFDGINPEEERNRWDRFNLLLLTLVLILNKFGYDFQISSEYEIKTDIQTPRKSKFLNQYFIFLKKYKLDDTSEVKSIIGIVNGSFLQKIVKWMSLLKKLIGQKQL